jgi:hypothetical protein
VAVLLCFEFDFAAKRKTLEAAGGCEHVQGCHLGESEGGYFGAPILLSEHLAQVGIRKA